MDDYYDMLRDYVKTSLVVVYGQSWCPHCRAARKVLGKRGVYVEMTSFESGISKQHKHVLKDLLEHDGGIPIIFVGQKQIANQDLEKHVGVSRKRNSQNKAIVEHEEQQEEQQEEESTKHAKNNSISTKRKRFGKMPSLADQLRAAAKPK